MRNVNVRSRRGQDSKAQPSTQLPAAPIRIKEGEPLTPKPLASKNTSRGSPVVGPVPTFSNQNAIDGPPIVKVPCCEASFPASLRGNSESKRCRHPPPR